MTRPATICLQLFLACVSLAGLSCNEGLAPSGTPAQALGAFSGTIRFINWDSAGTVVDLRLVAFKTFPPNDILQEVIQGRAFVFPPLGAGQLVPVGTDSLVYTVMLSAGVYEYVAVAQQFGPDVMADWRPVGQYDPDSDPTVPTAIMVSTADTLADVNIMVDFDNLPPPPF